LQGELLCVLFATQKGRELLCAFSFLALLKKTRLASSFFALQKRKKGGEET
jgi:hypothetical protein